MKRIISLMLVISMMLSTIISSHGLEVESPKKHWANDLLELAVKEGIIQTRDVHSIEEFDLDEQMTRAQYVSLINQLFHFDTMSDDEISKLSPHARVLNSKADIFKDISDINTKKQVMIAYSLGYVNGVSKDQFAPSAKLTREQAIVMMYRVFKIYYEQTSDKMPSSDTKLEKVFKDHEDISSWAKEAVIFFVDKKILKGFSDGTFAPKSNLSAAQSLAVLLPSKELKLEVEKEIREENEQKLKLQKLNSQHAHSSNSYDPSDEVREHETPSKPETQKPDEKNPNGQGQNPNEKNPNEQGQNPNENKYLQLYKLSDSLYIANINKDEEMERARIEFFKKFPQIDREKIYMGKVFKDSSKLLIFADSIQSDALNAKPLDPSSLHLHQVVDGLYVSDENNDLIAVEKEQIDNQAPRKITIVAGKVELDDKYFVSKAIAGLPGNSLNVGIVLNAQTTLVEGLNFNVENTPSSALQYDSAIAQAGKHKVDNPSNLRIVGNTIHFGQNPIACKSGIHITLPVTSGVLQIEKNTIIGNGAKTIENDKYNGTAIALNTRAQENTTVNIINNTVTNFPYHGIGVSVGKDSNVNVEGNVLTNIGQNAIGVFVHELENALHIKNNVVNSYGTKIIKSGSYGGPVTVGNRYETGISLEYIYSVYGVKVNDKYYNEKQILTDDLLLHDNKILSKLENDAFEGVHDSTPVYIGQRGRFHNPVEELNSSSYIPKSADFIVYKPDDGDLILGQNPKKPNEKRSINNLLVIGNGSGRVVLSNTLQIRGNLVIDLPNATLKHQAQVLGETHIKAIRGNDNSSFGANLNVEEIYQNNALDQAVEILISDITNQKGDAIDAAKSNLNENIKVSDDSKILSKSDYTVNEEEDKILLSKEYLKTLTKHTKFTIEYEDEANGVRMIKKFADLKILNKSSAKLSFVDEANSSIIAAFAPEEGIKIKISEIKNVLGESVEKEKSNLLSNLEILYLYSNKAQAQDFEIDDDEDIITLKKSLLDKIPTPLFGNVHTLKLNFSDESNSVFQVELKIDLTVINHSKNSGEVEALSAMTFTQGRAPANGISFKISGMKNAKGETLRPDQTSLEDHLTVIPFPVHWNFEMEGSGDKVGFKKELYTIDDERDIITFKAQYLNKLNSRSDMFAERGVKQYQFKYSDPATATDFISPKMLIHIKSRLQPLSQNTDISSKVFEIRNAVISSGSRTIGETLTVSEFIEGIDRGEIRQTLRVYDAKYNKNRSVEKADLYSYKNDEETLKKGDFLLVTAEDGKTSKLYEITLEDGQQTSLLVRIDESLVSFVGKDFIQLKKDNITVQEFLDATTIKEGAGKQIHQKESGIIQITPQPDDILDSDMKLVITSGELREEYLFKSHSKVVYRALIVGNSDYPGDKLDLAGPANDIHLMTRTFAAQRFDNEAFSQIKSIANATKEEFIAKVKESFKDADDNDISYLYYSGHGNNIDGMSYLCTVDHVENPDELKNHWVSTSELRSILDEVKGMKIIILDSCNSGGFIGKDAIDAITGPTPKPGNLEHSNFVNHVVREFTTNEATTPNYLIGNRYKVLAASSANEYSFDDKINKVGKFTKSLSEGAGINGSLLADSNHDNIVDLEEIYNYTEDHVVYTSHVQAFPRNDSFVIFSNPQIVALSDNVDVSAGEDFKVIIRGKLKMISSKNLEINTDMSVEQFLNHIIKAEPSQELYVIPTLVEANAQHAKAPDAKLAKLDRLLVISESGASATYTISVKKILSDELSIQSAGQGWGRKLMIMESGPLSPNPTISSTPTNEISTKTKVSDFLSFIIKGHEKQELYIIGKDQALEKTNAKAEDDTLSIGDRLLIYSESQKTKVYEIIIRRTPEDALNFGGEFRIEGAGMQYRIVSGTTKIHDKMKLSEFKEKILNQSEIRQIRLTDKDYEAKTDDDVLQNDDRLVIMLNSEHRPFSYSIQVEASETSTPDGNTTLPVPPIIVPETPDNSGGSGDISIPVPPIIITPDDSDSSGGSGDGENSNGSGDAGSSSDSSDSENSASSEKNENPENSGSTETSEKPQNSENNNDGGEINIPVPPIIITP